MATHFPAFGPDRLGGPLVGTGEVVGWCRFVACSLFGAAALRPAAQSLEQFLFPMEHPGRARGRLFSSLACAAFALRRRTNRSEVVSGKFCKSR